MVFLCMEDASNRIVLPGGKKKNLPMTSPDGAGLQNHRCTVRAHCAGIMAL